MSTRQQNTIKAPSNDANRDPHFEGGEEDLFFSKQHLQAKPKMMQPTKARPKMMQPTWARHKMMQSTLTRPKMMQPAQARPK